MLFLFLFSKTKPGTILFEVIVAIWNGLSMITNYVQHSSALFKWNLILSWKQQSSHYCGGPEGWQNWFMRKDCMSLLSLTYMNKRGEPVNNQQTLEGYNEKKTVWKRKSKWSWEAAINWNENSYLNTRQELSLDSLKITVFNMLILWMTP